ncbi:MAG: hypothetical protein ACOCX4_06280 [Planctomycetota bacterium]
MVQPTHFMKAGSRPLSLVVEDGGPFALPEALARIAEAARAAAERHSWGETFGWIGPEQALLEPDGTLVLMPADPTVDADPGLFRAPELEDAKACSTRADVYSLGVLFRYLLTGRPNGRLGRLPAPLDAFVERAEHPDPQARFQTAAALAREAEELLRDAGRLAEAWTQLNVPLSRRMTKSVKEVASRQWIAICLAVVLLAAGGGLGWRYWVAYRQAVDEARVRRNLRSAAESAWRKEQYRDAAVQYEALLGRTEDPGRRAAVLRRLVDCYARLRDPAAEQQAIRRFLVEVRDAPDAAALETRLLELSAAAAAQFGGVRVIASERVMVVDGRKDDWDGIEPLVVDRAGDLPKRMGGDLAGFYAQVVGDRLYLRVDTHDAPAASARHAYCIGVDVDVQSFTDDPADWDYELGFSGQIPSWIWDLRGQKDYASTSSSRLVGAEFAVGEVVEMSVPLAAFNTPPVFSLRAKTYDTARKRDIDLLDRKAIVALKRLGPGAPPTPGPNAPDAPATP